MRNDKPNVIVDLTFEFSLKIIEFSELLESKRKFNLANQLFVLELQLAQMFGEHRMPRARLTSSINLKFPQRK